MTQNPKGIEPSRWKCKSDDCTNLTDEDHCFSCEQATRPVRGYGFDQPAMLHAWREWWWRWSWLRVVYGLRIPFRGVW